MEELFKQNLLKLRKPHNPLTFGEALFPNAYWKLEGAASSKSPVVAKKNFISEEFSEKKQVIESFERFAKEKVAQSTDGVMKVEGGELGLKSLAAWEGIRRFSSISELESGLSVSREFSQILFKDKAPDKIQVMFVTETFRPWEEVSRELKEGFINELLVGFPLKTAELFERMIMAMRLTKDEVVLYPVECEGQDVGAEVMALAGLFRPEVIVTLGAKATQKILKTNDRLTMVHGQFFPRALSESETFQVVPLFHPSIIETNQNMKKTAWTDMQKIMKHLKKLP